MCHDLLAVKENSFETGSDLFYVLTIHLKERVTPELHRRSLVFQHDNFGHQVADLEKLEEENQRKIE